MNAADGRGRHALDHMAHQCTSEHDWFRNMFGIDTGEPPATGTRAAFAEAYVRDSGARLAALETKDDLWWESEVSFFDVVRSRAWIMVRRIAHTAHHRGQQTCLLRMLGRDVLSTYGPTADTRERVMYRSFRLRSRLAESLLQLGAGDGNRTRDQQLGRL